MSTLNNPLAPVSDHTREHILNVISHSADMPSRTTAAREKYKSNFSALHVAMIAGFCDSTWYSINNVPIIWKSLSLFSTGISFTYEPGYGLSTCDDNRLTRLVIMAHDAGWQISIKPKTALAFTVTISKWKRWGGEAGSWNSNHLNLEQAIRAYRQNEFVPQDGGPRVSGDDSHFPPEVSQ